MDNAPLVEKDKLQEENPPGNKKESKMHAPGIGRTRNRPQSTVLHSLAGSRIDTTEISSHSTFGTFWRTLCYLFPKGS